MLLCSSRSLAWALITSVGFRVRRIRSREDTRATSPHSSDQVVVNKGCPAAMPDHPCGARDREIGDAPIPYGRCSPDLRAGCGGGDHIPPSGSERDGQVVNPGPAYQDVHRIPDLPAFPPAFPRRERAEHPCIRTTRRPVSDRLSRRCKYWFGRYLRVQELRVCSHAARRYLPNAEVRCSFRRRPFVKPSSDGLGALWRVAVDPRRSRSCPSKTLRQPPPSGVR